jgi:hypothetical protein
MGSQTITKPAKAVLLEFEYPVSRNTTSNAILFWLAPDGSEREYARLSTSSERFVVHSQATYEGEVWRVRDPARGSALLLDYVATGAETQRVVICDGGAGNALGQGRGAAAANNHDEHFQRQAAEYQARTGGEPSAGSVIDEEERRTQVFARWSAPAEATEAVAGAAATGTVATAALESGALAAVSLEDARALSVQLSAQASASARARTQRSADGHPPPSEAEARLQVRFPDLDGSVLTLRLAESESIQRLLDEILEHADAVVARLAAAAAAPPSHETAAVAGGQSQPRQQPGAASDGAGTEFNLKAAASTELCVACRTPALVLSLARSGLVRAAEPVGAHLATVGSLGLLPSAVLHVTHLAS